MSTNCICCVKNKRTGWDLLCDTCREEQVNSFVQAVEAKVGEVKDRKSFRLRYEKAVHAMQSGVAAEMNLHPGPTEPKHLRVGVNSAMVDSAAMARLLIAKGIITEDEYLEAVATQMEDEVRRYREILSRHHNREIDLV